MYKVEPITEPFRATVRVPGSKSYTHRMLIAAALSEGRSSIQNALDSEDTRLTAQALDVMGPAVAWDDECITVDGCGGQLRPVDTEIDLRHSGTSMRLLTAVAALGRHPYTLTGSQRMQQRPIQDLVDSLLQLGVEARTRSDTGCPPVQICGPPVRGGVVKVNCGLSSQFLSALMLIAPCVPGGLDIEVSRGPVSRPYVDLTVEVLRGFGIRVERTGYRRFSISGNQAYRNGHYRVEPDVSQAGYFWAAAAVTGAKVTVEGIDTDSVQGDMGLLDLLEKMGCRVARTACGLSVVGGKLKAIEADMADMPDVVPTIAVVAAFAGGTSRLGNVAHLALKESNRLEAVVNELNRMNITAKLQPPDLVIQGGSPNGAVVETYNDHRIAMSFAVAGLMVPGVVIRGPGCVKKSFPRFWEVFERLYQA
jgi:3-phosphoshikimate 1-carboxyvinyltransferase